MPLSPETRALKIASYGSSYETLVVGLEKFPAEMWNFRDEHGCWSIHEHLAHIADSEANSLLRRQTYELIRSLPESVWANVCYHPENGDMTLDDWLLIYESHIPEHLGFMQENYDAWLQSGQG